MANPTLVKAFDSNGTNTTPIIEAKQTDGFLIGETVPSNVHNELFKQSIEGLNKSRNDGIWDWENPSGGNTVYSKGSLVRYLGVNYESLKNANTATPSNDLVNWKSISNLAQLSGATFTGQVKGITPLSANDLTRKDYVDGKVLAIASTAEAQAGTSNTTVITPLRLREGLNASGTAPIYACRAWVNFNGTGTVAIRASGNVSSITDNGTGDYTVNFTTAMPDVNYSCYGFTNYIGGWVNGKNITNSTTSRAIHVTISSSLVDAPEVFLGFIR